MILRRISLERYGCFGSGEFEFRRGMNLVCGGNDAGKSLLLAVLPAVVLGVEHGSRLRRWGDSLSCRATLFFEDGAQQVRLSRELENHLVRLEEAGADGQWRECFAGRVAPALHTPDHDHYFGHLQRLFGVAGEPLLRAILDSHAAAAVLAGDGRLPAGIVAAGSGTGTFTPVPAAVTASADRTAEIAALEAELAADREQCRKGEEYLAWIRRRWAAAGPASAAQTKAPAGSRAGRAGSALVQQRAELAAQIRSQGLPEQLPVDLPELFATAEEVRKELAGLQQVLTPLQRSRQGAALPGLLWPAVGTLVALTVPVTAYLAKLPLLNVLAGGCGLLLLLAWGGYLTGLFRARRLRAGLDREIQAAESKRAHVVARQSELAERFEALGLPSTPVEMVKLQQLCQRNHALLERYREVCAQLGGGSPPLPVPGGEPLADRHLRPEELPEAEQRLAELQASLRQREQRLQALRTGRTGAPPAAPVAPVAPVAPPGLPDADTLLPLAAQLLDRLTGGRYREVRLVDGRLHLEAAPGQWVPAVACGRGTVDALGLALRLAVWQTSAARLPLPVDELPATFDARRRLAALRTLESCAITQQVVLASADDELTKRARRERWHVIKLKSGQEGRQPLGGKETGDAGQLHLL